MKKIIIPLAALIVSASTLLFAEDAEDKAPENGFSILDIFSYEHPVRKGEDEKKWNFSASGSYIQKKGNTDSLDTTYSASVKYDDTIISFKTSFSGAYGRTLGVKDENYGNLTLGFDWYMLWRLEFFSYSMSDYNEMTELRHRNDSGIGLKFILIRNRYLLMDISGAPVLQYEKHDELDELIDWRWSIRGRVEIFPFDSDFSIKYYTFYVQKMDDTANYRTIHDVYLYKKLIGVLGIKAGYRREFDTHTKEYFEQYPDVKKTDETYYVQASITL